MSTVIEQSVQARLITPAPRTPNVSATLRYDLEDPFAVHILFPSSATLDGAAVTWAFARELLQAGTTGQAGEGDVRIRPYGYGRTVLEFHAAEGTAMVHVRTSELRQFLDLTAILVPEGDEYEHLRLDHDLMELLRDAR